MTGFRNRTEAGHALAEDLKTHAFPNPVVLALPRGGVPIGAEVARKLSAPLDLVMVRKIGVPIQPELAAAAVVNGAHPEIVANDEVMRMAGLSRSDIDRLAAVQLEEIRRRRELYLKGRARTEVAGQTAIVVDDGIATGATMRAALIAVRRQKPDWLVLAVPVAPRDTVALLRGEVDEAICLQMPEHFYAIGAHYADFSPVPDDAVYRTLSALDTEQDQLQA